MLKVRKDLCLGCGLCAENCPTGAISLRWGHAEINQSQCNRCQLCLDICPQGAIGEIVPISTDDLEATVSSLKHKASDLIERIENLKNRS
jgi:Fe-S-cluster-containing hydrogenase component 2